MAVACGPSVNEPGESSGAGESEVTSAGDAAGDASGGEAGDEAGESGESETGAVACQPECVIDNAGHACCAETFGAGYFCNERNMCSPVAGCEALDCCVPGVEGDAYCAMNFGEGATCIPDGEDGRCRRPDAGDCRELGPDTCTASAGCMPIWLSPLEPSPVGTMCVSDTAEFMACAPATGCGDFSMVFCDEQGTPWWSPDTCGPPGWNACDVPWQFC
jgi:hypothetical protein